MRIATQPVTDLPPVRWTPYSKHTRSPLWPSPRPRRDIRLSSGIELVALHRAGRSIPELSREFGPTPWTIALWVKQAARDAGRGDGGLTTNEREELARLRRENKRMKMEREILAKAAAWFAQETTPNSKRSSDS
jgi:transposase